VKLFLPADAPFWLTVLGRSIEDKFRNILSSPLRLMGLGTAELPAPADHGQGLVYDLDTAEILYSTGSGWNRLFGSNNAALGAVGSLAPAADTYVYYTGADSAALGTITPFARSLLDDADPAEALVTLGVAGASHGHVIADISGLQSALDSKLDDSQATPFSLGLLGAASAFAARQTLGAEAAIAAGTGTQYWRGDKSWQTLAAAAVANSPFGSISAPNVQAAIDELETEKQPRDSELTAIAGLASAADRLPYFTGSGTASLAVFTAAGRALVDDSDAAAQRATLGAEAAITPGTSAQYWRGDKTWINLIAGLVGNTPAGSISATNVQQAINELDSEKQPLDSELTAIAGLASAADRLPYFTGSGTAALATFTAAGRALVDDVSAAAQRTTLGAEAAIPLGSTAQYWRGDKSWQNLTASVVGNTPAGNIGAFTVQAAINELDAEKQPLDAELTAIAGLTSAVDTIPYFTGAGTAALATFSSAARALLDDFSPAAQRTTLELGNVTNTSDMNKPVSLLQQAALDAKASLAQARVAGRARVWEVGGLPRYFPPDGFELAANTSPIAVNRIYFLPFNMYLKISHLAVEVTTASGVAGSGIRLGIYRCGGTLGHPASLLIDAGTAATDSVGIKEVAAVVTIDEPVWLAAICDTAFTMRSGTISPARNLQLFGLDVLNANPSHLAVPFATAGLVADGQPFLPFAGTAPAVTGFFSVPRVVAVRGAIA
jgi:hypothetical protein